MPKGPTLTASEREEIATLRASNLSARDIAKRIDRSKTVVLNFLKSPATYGTTKRSGRKRALSKAQEEQIFRALSAGRLPVESDSGDGGGGEERSGAFKLSAERIKQEFALPLSTRRVQQLLSDWRRSARKALDQQHALAGEEEDDQGAKHDEEAVGQVGQAAPPPSLPPPALSVLPAEEMSSAQGHQEEEEEEDDDDDGNRSLLEAIPAPAPLVLEDDVALEMEPSASTEGVQV